MTSRYELEIASSYGWCIAGSETFATIEGAKAYGQGFRHKKRIVMVTNGRRDIVVESYA